MVEMIGGSLMAVFGTICLWVSTHDEPSLIGLGLGGGLFLGGLSCVMDFVG